MFENPAPAVKTSCKLNNILKKYYEISTMYKCVEKLSMHIGTTVTTF